MNENKRKALILAGSRGIGLACAEQLAAQDIDLVLVARDKQTLNASQQFLTNKFNINVSVESVDITDSIDLECMLANLTDIDILLTNCGGPPAGKLEDFDAQIWDQAYASQIRSAVLACRHLVPEMAKRDWGRVVMISSVAVKHGLPGLILSNSLRPGLHGLAKSIALEYAASNVTANLVAPGYTETERMQQLIIKISEERGISENEVIESMTAAIPAGRMAHPKEIASVAAFLASEDASYVNGQAICVDGGFSN